jgi:hypothetical protein
MGNYSEQSAPITVTSADAEAPTKPTYLAAVVKTDTRVLLVWTPSRDNVKVAGYEIYRDGVRVGTSANLLFLDKGLTQNITYKYTVRAYDAAGNVSGDSNTATAKTLMKVKINFQPKDAAVPDGYIIDDGEVLGARNGLQYGWNSSHTNMAYDRNINSDQTLDTVISLQKKGTWQMNVPNGIYLVTVSVGDAKESSTNSIKIGKTEYWKKLKLGANRFEQKSNLITVTNGTIIIDQGNSSDTGTRINYVHVTEILDIPVQYKSLFMNE